MLTKIEIAMANVQTEIDLCRKALTNKTAKLDVKEYYNDRLSKLLVIRSLLIRTSFNELNLSLELINSDRWRTYG